MYIMSDERHETDSDSENSSMPGLKKRNQRSSEIHETFSDVENSSMTGSLAR